MYTLFAGARSPRSECLCRVVVAIQNSIGRRKLYNPVRSIVTVTREITAESPEDAVEEWFRALGTYCANEDYDAAREIVAEDVKSFGTKAEIVSGLDRLQENQWSGIWPNTEDFSFDLDEVVASGEGDTAWGAATWSSTGFDEDGDPFHRPGRATVALERRDGIWLAVHTHFSLHPGTPQFTYGRSGKSD